MSIYFTTGEIFQNEYLKVDPFYDKHDKGALWLYAQ